jgi:cyclophilin family peptidyl-prolyl cis-trans isomerase/protein-disulfide isomerase
MRKFQLLIVFVLLASLLLSACQAATQGSTPTAEASSGGPRVSSQTGDPTTCVISSLIPEIPAAQQIPVPPVSDSDWVIGPRDAEISIVVYTDFQCPYCAKAAPELESFQADHADRVNVVVRYFPLVSIHDRAMSSARAAEAAGAQGKFFEMHDALFQSQNTWGATGYTLEQFDQYALDLASQIGLDVDKFSADYQDAATQAKVDAAYADASEKLGLTGTPSVFIFINGVAYQASYAYATLQSIVDLIDFDKTTYKTCPPMVIDTAKKYTATIKTTKGDLVIDLYPDKAPLTVNSFVFLARDGYFDGVPFHRVLKDFVAQTGDPLGSGMGGPGYTYVNEISDLKFDSEGVVGMANSGADQNGSQFFITYAAQASLDGSYTVFGKLTQGMDVLNTLVARDPSTEAVLADPDRILSVTIKEK